MAHKHKLHKLTMPRILSQASELFCRFCLPGMLVNLHVYILTAVIMFFLFIVNFRGSVSFARSFKEIRTPLLNEYVL